MARGRCFIDDFSGPPHTDLVTVNPQCPDAAHHTPAPMGYIARQEWAKRMSKTHQQITCQSCGLYVIWLPKVEAKAELNRRRDETIEADRKCREQMSQRRKKAIK